MTENEPISAPENQLAQISQQIGRPQHAVGILEDAHAVRCLQYKYGNQVDKCLYDQAAALFAKAFNVFNHTNLDIPNTLNLFAEGCIVPVSNAGEIISTSNTSRRLQFAVKFLF